MSLVPIFDTFTKRKKLAERGGQPQIYQYENVPQPRRVQAAYIFRESLGGYREIGRYDYSMPPPSNRRWEMIRDAIARERGVFSLTGRNENPYEQCGGLLLQGTGDDALEVIEAAARYVDLVMRNKSDYEREQEGLSASAADAIAELNHRFKAHGVGYEYRDGMLIRVDSDMLHEEVTQPALRLLHEEGFDGPLEEFLHAHKHSVMARRRTQMSMR